MLLDTSNIWDSTADIIVVSACGIVRDGHLIMRTGSALQAATKYPALPSLAASQISRLRLWQDYDQCSCYTYGFTSITIDALHEIGLFQNKLWDGSETLMSMIGLGVASMNFWLSALRDDIKISMTYPDTETLARDSVLSILRDLPDSVTVHSLVELS